MTLLMSAVMALGISASAFAAPVGVVNVNAVRPPSSWQNLNRRKWLLYKEKSTKLFLT